MRKSLVMLLVFAMLSSVFFTLFAGALALADDGVVTQGFNDPASGYTDFVHPWVNWNLTRGDLQVSYSLDMSQYTGTDVSEVGIFDHKSATGAIGWMGTAAPTAEQYSNNFDQNDRLSLRTSRFWDNDYMTYDVVRNQDGTYTTYPWWPWGNVWDPWKSCGIWFDRAAADGTPQSALYNGKMCNTGGKYNVTITYHAIDAGNGVMFATVNGVPTGFYGLWPTTPYVGDPQYTPAGKAFVGDMASVQVYAKLAGQNVTITNLSATGSPAAPTLTSVSPNAAEQGDNIKGLLLNGTDFRPVPSTVQLKPDSGAAIKSTTVNCMDKCWVNADIKIPDTAVVGLYDTNFWHNDDTAKVASLPDSFKISYARPQITSTGSAHCRPNQTVTVTIKGKYFRNTPMTVKLVRGNESVTGKNVKWVSSTQVKADFTVPAGASISRYWDVYLAHNDDGKVATLASGFSVDAHIDIINPFGVFNWIWLRAPGILEVVLYSEGNFDATTIFPLAVDLGGTFPIATNPQDVNHDGKIDQIFYFNNMAVKLPVGINNVRMLGADWSLNSIQAWDTVKVFWFLF
jgi:hypothetical protein